MQVQVLFSAPFFMKYLEGSLRDDRPLLLGRFKYSCTKTLFLNTWPSRRTRSLVSLGPTSRTVTTSIEVRLPVRLRAPFPPGADCHPLRTPGKSISVDVTARASWSIACEDDWSPVQALSPGIARLTGNFRAAAAKSDGYAVWWYGSRRKDAANYAPAEVPAPDKKK